MRLFFDQRGLPKDPRRSRGITPASRRDQPEPLDVWSLPRLWRGTKSISRVICAAPGQSGRTFQDREGNLQSVRIYRPTPARAMRQQDVERRSIDQPLERRLPWMAVHPWHTPRPFWRLTLALSGARCALHHEQGVG